MTTAKLVYADDSGQIYDHPYLEMAGSSGGSWQRVDDTFLIPLPPGSELFLLPDRVPVGYDRDNQRFAKLGEISLDPGQTVQAVAAFMAPAHTQILTAAYHSEDNAPVLPLFSYTAVGWKEGQFVAAGVRVDPLVRQDIDQFDLEKLERRARRALDRQAHNRLIQHLGICALTYGCPAAKNYFLRRWEAPLPTSPQCNASCLGCISLQEDSQVCASQERITFVPSAEEIAEVAMGHLQKAIEPLVSFGQGCEGEPLLQGKTLAAATNLIRSQTGRGTINLNTNGSLPETIAQLRDSGLDSIRVSLNSAREVYYRNYYKPRGYSFTDVQASLRTMKSRGGFVSINLLTLPGISDEEEEVEAIIRLIDDTGIDLIQMRNLNMDPEWYLREIGYRATGRRLGILQMMAKIRQAHPQVGFGYFNPCLNPSPPPRPPCEQGEAGGSRALRRGGRADSEI
ncbi:MAG: radical SAM protein [Deltaproteobacteria bacterium]|nr:radical SAM protein [Deltaproteobacteria bacterium]